VITNDNTLVDAFPLMEDFYSIQGEGYYQGHAAYFVRLGGCDVGCVWCDVKESWDTGIHPVTSVKEIIAKIKSTAAEIVIITGGEPVMYNLKYLTDRLKAENFRTHLETSGVYQLTGDWDWVCFSPKKFKAPHPSIYEAANELKVVIYNQSDFAWAEKHAKMVNADCELFLQPEWSKEKEMLPKITEFIKMNPHWKISLQIHKYMNVR
jgi:organic radical activating enzyme